MSRNVVTREEKISAFSVNTAEYGAAVMEILGTTRISGNVIYYDDFTAHEHRETQRTGKGFGGKTTNITYTYTVAVILGLCEGPIGGIGKVWIGKELYTYPNEAIQLTLFKGTAEQSPWSYLTGKHPEKALSYPNLAYMAGVIDLGNSGSMPTYNFEVKGKLLSTGDGIDVNPADYILYILEKVGMGDVEIDGIDNYRAYCKAADLLISTPSDATGTQEAREIINDIASLTNAYVFWSNDRFKIVPLSDRPVGTWRPNTTILYDLTIDDLIPQTGGAAVTYSRKDSSEIHNRFTVEFLNRANGYEKESVSYEDTADIIDHGVRQSSTVKAH
ncbi:MAG: phage tail protein, partial [Selenomonadales bacterium]|nr:phage tail protein [Selenomonadales bacterium]